jgi:hypothetical protein
MEESRDAEHLLPEIEKLASATQAWPEAMQLALAVTERNISSARAVARDAAANLGKLPQAFHSSYLVDFRLVIESIGVRGIGFCLSTLPRLYEQPGVEITRNFVSLACQAGRNFGAAAGTAFLDRQTQASKASLGH